MILLKLLVISAVIVACAILGWYGYIKYTNKEIQQINNNEFTQESDYPDEEYDDDYTSAVSKNNETSNEDVTTQLLGISAALVNKKDVVLDISNNKTTEPYRHVLNPETSESFRITTKPNKKSTTTPADIFGISLQGALFDNGLLTYYLDEPKTGWTLNNTNYDADDFDNSNNTDLVHVGWASDGFPVAYSPNNIFKSSYQLQSGLRTSGPLGRYDGSYIEDWIYQEGHGDLDKCNGIDINNQYVYVITQEYPQIPRCVWGTPDESFKRQDTDTKQSISKDLRNDLRFNNSSSPIEAIDACKNKATSSPCQFEGKLGPIQGICNPPIGEEILACIPR